MAAPVANGLPATNNLGSNATTTNLHTTLPPAAVTVLHGTKRDKIEYTAAGTLWTLCGKIQDVTGIGRAQQVLLCSGRKLAVPSEESDNANVPLSKLLKPTTKIMVRSSGMTDIGRGSGSTSTSQQPTREEDINMKRLLEAERTAKQLNGRITTITEDVDRHIQGFLDHDQTLEALKKDEMNARQVDEDAMKLLEVLDSISFESLQCNKNARSIDIDRQRAARKAIVTSVNRLLVQVDNLRALIDEMCQDEFGELARRRGRMS